MHYNSIEFHYLDFAMHGSSSMMRANLGADISRICPVAMPLKRDSSTHQSLAHQDILTSSTAPLSCDIFLESARINAGARVLDPLIVCSTTYVRWIHANSECNHQYPQAQYSQRSALGVHRQCALARSSAIRRQLRHLELHSTRPRPLPVYQEDTSRGRGEMW
jgi:hypothetical protein